MSEEHKQQGYRWGIGEGILLGAVVVGIALGSVNITNSIIEENFKRDISTQIKNRMYDLTNEVYQTESLRNTNLVTTELDYLKSLNGFVTNYSFKRKID
ncbi:MAG: hypothetical protein WCK29_01055 [archaeon]